MICEHCKCDIADQELVTYEHKTYDWNCYEYHDTDTRYKNGIIAWYAGAFVRGSIKDAFGPVSEAAAKFVTLHYEYHENNRHNFTPYANWPIDIDKLLRSPSADGGCNCKITELMRYGCKCGGK